MGLHDARRRNEAARLAAEATQAVQGQQAVDERAAFLAYHGRVTPMMNRFSIALGKRHFFRKWRNQFAGDRERAFHALYPRRWDRTGSREEKLVTRHELKPGTFVWHGRQGYFEMGYLYVRLDVRNTWTCRSSVRMDYGLHRLDGPPVFSSNLDDPAVYVGWRSLRGQEHQEAMITNVENMVAASLDALGIPYDEVE